MNEQQQRMAAVGTDKELSDLLDFSAVRERESSPGWFLGGTGRKRECDTGVWGGDKGAQVAFGGLNERGMGSR